MSQLIIVPQRRYLARTTHLSQPLLPPIEFHINGQRGVRLSDALAGNMDGLDDPETAILGAVGTKVTYRLEVGSFGLRLCISILTLRCTWAHSFLDTGPLGSRNMQGTPLDRMTLILAGKS